MSVKTKRPTQGYPVKMSNGMFGVRIDLNDDMFPPRKLGFVTVITKTNRAWRSTLIRKIGGGPGYEIWKTK